MHRRLATLALALTCLIIPVAGFAAGFSVFEAGARALGTGGAFAARADDPSAIFFNPAGIVDLENWQATAGVSLIFTGTSFAGVDPDPGFGVTEKTIDHVFTPINAYVSWKFHEKWAAGVGLMNPFGLGQTWDNEDEFTGRHIVQEVDLVTFNITPVIAYRPATTVALSFGAQIVLGSVELTRAQQMWDPNGSGFLDVGTAKLEGSNDVDVGWTAGILIDATETTRVGISFRSQVDLDASGDATFVQSPSGNPAFDAAVSALWPDDQGVALQVNLPSMLWIGTMFEGVENWKFLVDLVFFGWSDFKTLEFVFDDPSLNVVRPQDYDDTVQIRLGAEYAVNEVWAVRGGYYYDPSPQPDPSISPLLADKDRHGITLGVGYTSGRWWADAFGLALISPDRSTNGESLDQYNGTYGSYGYLAGINVGFTWGGGEQE